MVFRPDSIANKPAPQKEPFSEEEIAGPKYEAAMQELQELRAALEKYDYKMYDVVAFEQEFEPGVLQKILASWLDKVRQQTTVLDEVDKLGIRIFGEDLTNQEQHPSVSVEFDSESLSQYNAFNPSNKVGGRHFLSKVLIAGSEPGIGLQLQAVVRGERIPHTATGKIT